MAVTLAPHALKVRLRDVTTGAVIERWPVDARELIATGAYAPASEQAPPIAPVAEATRTESPVPAGTASGAVGGTPGEGTHDPMPHVTQAVARNAQQSPTGAPLAIAPVEGVSSAAPMQLPTGRVPSSGVAASPPKGARR